MKRFRKLTAVLILFILLFTTMSTVAAQGQQNQDDENYIFIQQMMNFIKANYKYEISDEELLQGAIKKMIEEDPELLEKAVEGMFEKLDDYSTFFNEQQYENFSTEVQGQFGGIGIMITNKDGYVTVLAPMDNTPGKRAGIQSGDKIVLVDGTDITGYDTNIAVKLMRGEEGTSVTLGIKREGVSELLYFDIVREIIKINPITYKIIDETIGYIKISDFNANTDEYLEEALVHFDEANITKIIIDVRNNPGGSLSEVVEVAKHFIPKGPIVHIEYKDDKLETLKSDLEKAKYEVAVLVNKGSASASEIFAGAIQDSKVGKVVGQQSFGKGTVQQLIPLRIGGAAKMTIARYLTPNKRVIDGIGIEPDIKVQNIKQKLDTTSLEKMDILRKPTLGDKGKDILAAEQRLELLGYDIDTPDELLDQKTFDAIKRFQEEQQLFAYGVLDFTTQIALNEIVNELEVEIDKQLERAIEILKK